MPLTFPNIGDSAEFVGQADSLPHTGALNLTHEYARIPAILQANPLSAHFYVAPAGTYPRC
jgi:hypothetical protein